MRDSNDQKLSEILKDFLWQNKNRDKLIEQKLISLWGKCVGKNISNHCYEHRYRKGKFTVKVSSSVVRNELIYIVKDITEKINQTWEDSPLEQIILR